MDDLTTKKAACREALLREAMQQGTQPGEWHMLQFAAALEVVESELASNLDRAAAMINDHLARNAFAVRLVLTTGEDLPTWERLTGLPQPPYPKPIIRTYRGFRWPQDAAVLEENLAQVLPG